MTDEEQTDEQREAAEHERIEKETEAGLQSSGVLAGTSSERAAGVGGGGEHPAPAIMRDPETGALRQHGEAPSSATDSVPVGDSSDEESDGTDPRYSKE
jgi:hypothetical protein